MSNNFNFNEEINKRMKEAKVLETQACLLQYGQNMQLMQNLQSMQNMQNAESLQNWHNMQNAENLRNFMPQANMFIDAPPTSFLDFQQKMELQIYSAVPACQEAPQMMPQFPAGQHAPQMQMQPMPQMQVAPVGFQSNDNRVIRVALLPPLEVVNNEILSQIRSNMIPSMKKDDLKNGGSLY